LRDPKVVEIILNADGRIWVDRLGEGVGATDACMGPADAERMLRLVASEILVELNAAAPSLAAKLPAPYAARLQASKGRCEVPMARTQLEEFRAPRAERLTRRKDLRPLPKPSPEASPRDHQARLADEGPVFVDTVDPKRLRDGARLQSSTSSVSRVEDLRKISIHRQPRSGQ
jgi:hypothetical protein